MAKTKDEEPVQDVIKETVETTTTDGVQEVNENTSEVTETISNEVTDSPAENETKAFVPTAMEFPGKMVLTKTTILDLETGKQLNPTQVYNRLHAWADENLAPEDTNEA